MSLYKKILQGEEKIALVGLGYVGMPIAVAFAKKVKVIGFDLNREKIALYQRGCDPTGEVGDEAIRNTKVEFTSEEENLRKAKFFIVAVPTPVNQDKTPDLSPVEGASRVVGRNLTKGSVVVFESTVYPGVTEDVCVPILEKESGLVCGVDFKVGYSPERINPGDRVHRLENIRKIVSGMDREALEEIRQVYDLVIEVGTYPVSSIKTAEAIKVVENSQRDINIAFMNELAMVFDRMGIDTNEVVDGMNTKWNALGFRPGLVGGHCIGVDPYYFTYEAEKLGYHSQIILAGRKVNDGMGSFVADATIKQLVLAGKAPKNRSRTPSRAASVILPSYRKPYRTSAVLQAGSAFSTAGLSAFTAGRKPMLSEKGSSSSAISRVAAGKTSASWKSSSKVRPKSYSNRLKNSPLKHSRSSSSQGRSRFSGKK